MKHIDKQTTIDSENEEMQQALQILNFTNRSLFLTGKAGTGKSTFLRYVASHTKKKHIVLAPTGIAAINAGGATLHSFFHLPFYPLVPTDVRYDARHIRDTLKYSSEQIKLIRTLELIIIDEVSMVRADIIDFIDKVLRIYCGKMREPFGGKQIMLVGDVFQLEPVLKDDERQMLAPFYPSAYFFHARAFTQVPLVAIELKKVYRQSDSTFISILDAIRVSQVSDHQLKLLNSRVDNRLGTENEAHVEGDELSITLSTRRDVVDYINNFHLKRLEGDSEIYKGTIKGTFPTNSLPTPLELELKIGAQILFVKNDVQKRWVNGTLGTIIGFDEENHDFIYVRTEKGKDVEVEREVWSNIVYTYNKEENKVEENEIGSYEHFPLRLAWAITIHKSQGLTFSHVNIDLTGGAFAGGQTYVALSRCTSLEGIRLKGVIRRSDIFVRNEVLRFANQFNDRTLIDLSLKQSKADQSYHDAVAAFDKGDFQTFIDKFFVAIHSRYDIEHPIVKRYIRKKLNVINQQKLEIERLKEKENERRQLLMRLAVEYVMMGRDCEKEHMHEAALRNYEKALELCPDMPEAQRKVKRLQKRFSDNAKDGK